MPVEIQIYLNKAGLSWKAPLLGSHCHDSEGASEVQRGESLVIAEIHFSFSLKTSLYFFPVWMTRSPAQQEEVSRKTQVWSCTVSPCGDTRIFQMYPRSWWGNGWRSPCALIMGEWLDVTTMGSKQALVLTSSASWLPVLTDRARTGSHQSINLVALVSRASMACAPHVNPGSWGSSLLLWAATVLKESGVLGCEKKCC